MRRNLFFKVLSYAYWPLVFVAVLFCFVQFARAASMTETPVVGAVTTSSAKIAVRTDSSADVEIEYATNKFFNNSTTTTAITSSSGDDYTVTVPLSGLSSGTMHWFRVLVDSTQQNTGYVHKFSTMPTGSPSYSFAVFADVAPQDKAAAAYNSAKNDGALFAMQIGDFDHRDPTSLAEARQMHRDMKDNSNLHGADFAQNISSKMGVVHVWDDHDYCGNDSDRTCTIRSDMWKAFDEHWPTHDRPNGSAGLWRSFIVGDAEFFILDLRSQRDPNSDTDNSNKSMLDGALITDDQKDWLKVGLSSSSKTWKVIISSVTVNPTARPAATDAWKSFSTERDEIRDYITNNSIDGVFVISADIHTGGAIDDGTNSAWEVPEMSCPHTNLVTGNTNNLGTWSEGVTSGARGYCLVTITSTTATLQVKAPNGTVRHSLAL